MKRAEYGSTRLWALGAFSVAAGLQTLVLTTQEGVFFAAALISAIVYYGILAMLSVPVWYFCRWSSSGDHSRLVVGGLHLLLALAVLATWQASYLALLYSMAGRVAIEEQLREGGL